MQPSLLPIGIQDFATIRANNFYYADKTFLINQLLTGGRNYFLSRPRRFGKSLLLDTIRCVFEGKECLFEGLCIHDQWDWSETYPIVRLSFGAKYTEPGDLNRSILSKLRLVERASDLELADSITTGPERLETIIQNLFLSTGKPVVVLVDEYDKPILDTLDRPEQALANRDYLRGFYGVIKDCAEYVRFVFVTGVSMFSKVSLFSGLNNLQNISLDSRYATLCGYTDHDLDTVFAPMLEGIDRKDVRDWYNGYNWLGREKVYNPHDVLLLLDNRTFEAHWFETATPTFLYDTFAKNSIGLAEVHNARVDKRALTRFDVQDIGLQALMFQSGYLTITDEYREGIHTSYHLTYPNREVKESLNAGLLEYFGVSDSERRIQTHVLTEYLRSKDFEGFARTFQSWVAGIPYQWHMQNDFARHEAWYKSLLCMCLSAQNIDLRMEEASRFGRADVVIVMDDTICIVEFKMASKLDDAEAALDRALMQIREQDYAAKYKHLNQPVYLIGMACDEEARNLLAVRVEEI